MKALFYFLNQHRLTNIISLFIVLLGLLALSNTNVDLIPPFDFKGVEIEVTYPEASAGDMEEYIVFPFEEKISNYPGLKSFSSKSKNGSASFSLRFPADQNNMSDVLNDVKAIVEEIRPRLPQGIRNITIKERKRTKTFQNYIVLKNYNPQNLEHENLVKGFKDKVLSLRGVAEVEVFSEDRKISIDFNEAKLKERELTVSEVLTEIRSFFKYVPLGNIRRGQDKTIIEFKKYNREDFLTKLQKFPVKTNAFGFSTQLQDVANVTYLFEELESKNYEGLKPSYSIRVEKDLNSDVLKNDKKIQDLIEDFNANTLGVVAKSIISGKGFIERQLNALKGNGLVGVIFVFLLLLGFLSFRSALCVVLGVPIAFLGVFVILFLYGMSINLLSVVGLILIVGILVDDALIVTEKYNEELSKGASPEESAKRAIKELFLPVLGTALTTIVAFSPLILIPSELGVILMSIPIVIIGALFFSVFESFFILPSHLVTIDKKPSVGFLNPLFIKIKNAYQVVVFYSLKYKYSMVLVLAGLTGSAIYFSMNVPKDFNLNISDEVIMVRGALKNTESKEDSLNQVKDLHAHLEKLTNRPEFIHLSTSVGGLWIPSTGYMTGDRYFNIKAYLDETHPQPGTVKTPVENKMKAFLEEYKKENDIFDFVSVQTGYANDDKNSDQKYLTVNFYTKSSGVDLSVKSILSDLPEKIEGLGEIELGADAKQVMRWSFDPDYSRMAQLGVDKDQLKDALLGKVQNAWLGEQRLDGEALEIITTINGKPVENKDFNPSKEFLTTKSGTKVSLGSLGRWSNQPSPETISHLNGFKIQQANFPILDGFNRDLILKQSKPIIAEINKSHPKHIVKSFGESVEEAENKSWIFKALVACILGIYFVLVLVLGSFLQPVIVSLPILFGVVGVLTAHKLHGMTLGVLSGVGLIGAIGVSVNGSLVMASQINDRLKEKRLSVLKSIEDGALSRFRAIFLTSITTLGGLFPMAYGWGGDAGFTKPLAFSMAWGVLLSSAMTLFFFPAIFAILESWSEKSRSLFNKKTKKSVANDVKVTGKKGVEKEAEAETETEAEVKPDYREDREDRELTPQEPWL